VVPKKETDKLFEMDASDLGAILQFAQPIAKAIEKAFPCQRCGMAVVGLEVPHAHVHLVPINTADDMNFTRPKLKPSQDELKETQEKILQALNQ
jgi:histidine triad (HIT) family protein